MYWPHTSCRAGCGAGTNSFCVGLLQRCDCGGDGSWGGAMYLGGAGGGEGGRGGSGGSGGHANMSDSTDGAAATAPSPTNGRYAQRRHRQAGKQRGRVRLALGEKFTEPLLAWRDAIISCHLISSSCSCPKVLKPPCRIHPTITSRRQPRRSQIHDDHTAPRRRSHSALHFTAYRTLLPSLEDAPFKMGLAGRTYQRRLLEDAAEQPGAAPALGREGEGDLVHAARLV